MSIWSARPCAFFQPTVECQQINNQLRIPLAFTNNKFTVPHAPLLNMVSKASHLHCVSWPHWLKNKTVESNLCSLATFGNHSLCGDHKVTLFVSQSPYIYSGKFLIAPVREMKESLARLLKFLMRHNIILLLRASTPRPAIMVEMAHNELIKDYILYWSLWTPLLKLCINKHMLIR